MRLERLELHVLGHVELSTVAAVFPTISIERVDEPGADAITAAAWVSDNLDFWAFDRQLDTICGRAEPVRLALAGADAAAITREVLTRAQRLAMRRNAASSEPWFERVLAEHRALHDLDKPLVRADLDHALDAWQWTLRLDADAAAAVQLATLLHDVERLFSEADARVEHHAPSYQAFKDAHALEGANLARALFERVGVPAVVADLAARLIATHERTGDDPALRSINDADALSFFSLNSPGYLAYFGPEQTSRKVAYTLARMSPAARAQLVGLRLPRMIRDQLLHHGHRA